MSARLKVLLVSFVGGVAVVSSTLALLKPVLTAALERAETAEVDVLARTVAAAMPYTPELWEPFLRDIRRRLPDVTLTVLRIVPDQPLGEQLRTAGLDRSHALTALARGKDFYFESSPGIATPVAVALVHLRGAGSSSGLLVARRPSRQFSNKVWGAVSLVLAVGALLAMAAGYAAGYFLLVKPSALAEGTASKALRRVGVEPRGDTARMIEQLARTLKDERIHLTRVKTELDRIRHDLRGAQASLVRAEKLASVGQLAAGIAHEVGNPIGIIMGLADLLGSRDVSEEEIDTYASEILKAARRVDAILKDILTFARPERDEGASTDVGKVAEETLALVGSHSRLKHVEKEIRIAESAKGVKAEIRPSQLEQVLVNLLLNAGAAMNGQGKVVIEVNADASFVCVTVDDNGPGVPENERERIFDPFYTTSAPGEGTGLGLSICAQIVGIYGGDIFLEDKKGPGARFVVRLWRAAEE